MCRTKGAAYFQTIGPSINLSSLSFGSLRPCSERVALVSLIMSAGTGDEVEEGLEGQSLRLADGK